MNIDVPHYVPRFIWQLWLSPPGRTQDGPRGPRVHVYDVDSSSLSETSSIPELCTRSVFQDLDCASSPSSRAAYDQAERAFIVLQNQAEEALKSLVDVLYPSVTPNITSRIPVRPQDLSSIIKFFVFLRFRNGPHYRMIVQELMEPIDFQVTSSNIPGAKGNMVLSVYSPLIRQVRLQTVLDGFRRFFETPIWEMKPSMPQQIHSRDTNLIPPEICIPSYAFKTDHYFGRNDICLSALDRYCWQCCLEADICLGIAVEDDREFILPECCFGVLDEGFGGGVSVRKSPESESFHSFFPILPTLALYILRDEGMDMQSHLPSFVQVGTELELDIHLRNAMVLSSVPLKRTIEKFIPHDKTPVIELDQITWFSASSSSDSESAPTIISPNDILEHLATKISDISMSGNTGSDAITVNESSAVSETPEVFGSRIFFSSLSSIARSISSYDEFRCRWMPDNFVDYSRLKQRCRQKFSLEALKKMWTLKRNVVLSDLTDEVEVIGDHAVAFGTFSDVYMGKWYDAVERKHRVVAIKYLRQVMVQGVREKLFKRLRAELLTWYQLCHRNLSPLYGIIQTSTSIGMVSAWCENGTISNYLQKKPGADRLKLVIQVASGVAYLHHFNPPVVHGDLKGCNILVDTHEQAVITDFGLSKVMEDLSNLSHDGEHGKGRSTSSSLGGSIRWMAPDLVLALVEDKDLRLGLETSREKEKRGPRVTTASDVYAFASVCLEIATGNLPFAHRPNDYAVLVDILGGVSPARGSDLNNALKCLFKIPTETSTSSSSSISYTIGPSLPTEQADEVFRGVLERCWDKEACTRPTMEEVLVCLNGFGMSES
ncbi:kinase-like domain-containing protein [Rhodocollybia butyracea]|uniref:Kinase-like domain-containing protein n=1 Tax=Rhodocollybia butyracea TaxID=206335 RepID=A0A9P5PEL5_9AGAR|nr:kinase-like domain-containing protein [Rhodocollybia butyracea]